MCIYMAVLFMVLYSNLFPSTPPHKFEMLDTEVTHRLFIGVL